LFTILFTTGDNNGPVKKQKKFRIISKVANREPGVAVAFVEIAWEVSIHIVTKWNDVTSDRGRGYLAFDIIDRQNIIFIEAVVDPAGLEYRT
jgi:hypothetical protein